MKWFLITVRQEVKSIDNSVVVHGPINKHPKLSCHMVLMPINDRRLMAFFCVLVGDSPRSHDALTALTMPSLHFHSIRTALTECLRPSDISKNASSYCPSSPAKVSSYLPFDKPFASRPSKFIISAD